MSAASASEFRSPALAINRVYTRRGDAGQTSLVGGHRVPKNNLRIECYGTVDELNALVGAARVHALKDPRSASLAGTLLTVQHQLFNLGSMLATLPEEVKQQQPAIRDHEITTLESLIDRYNDTLPELRSFVLPGSSEIDAVLHQCRTVCRRAERICCGLIDQSQLEHGGSANPDHVAIQYLNRLSDAFFVWGRWTSAVLDIAEVLWDPNLSS